MTRNKILVVGANGELGQAILSAIGPEIAIAATRSGVSPLPGYTQVKLASDGAPPATALQSCAAIINAAGSVNGDQEMLELANVQLPLMLASAAKTAGVAKMVQVSSFSVYASTEYIDRSTAEQPASSYGHSKAKGDEAILKFADNHFAVECLRLPFMFSANRPGLLGPLLSMAERLRFLPSVNGKHIARSMISYRDAAKTLVGCANDTRSGRSIAADPQLFDYPLLTRILTEETERMIRIVALPSSLAAGIEWLIPSVGRRLFRSNVLSEQDNRAGTQPLGLESELRKLIKLRYGL
jgi:dTDP-4-dehydrorhamnose reductase